MLSLRMEQDDSETARKALQFYKNENIHDLFFDIAVFFPVTYPGSMRMFLATLFELIKDCKQSKCLAIGD